ncbi:MAG: formate C-acetyltransferase/glycerol dehydratase family glycyl radical enzyme, partial [Thermodesulfovibrionales bacterium]
MANKKNRKPVTGRILKLKNKIFSNARKVDIERARLFTESYQKNHDKPLVLKRALALAYVLENMSITIDPEALIAGDKTVNPRSGDISPEMAVKWIDEELESLSERPQDKFDAANEDISELRENIFPYWLGKTLEDAAGSAIKGKIREATEEGVFLINQTNHGQGHIIPDVKKWLSIGICGLKKEIGQFLDISLKSPEKINGKINFYRASLIALEASISFIKRYAALAREMSLDCSGENKENLEKVSEICTTLTQRPADSFREAVQAVWFLFVILQIESNVTSISPGRLDQYLYKYYKKDIDSKIISKIDAQEILENLWLNFNKIVFLRSSESAKYFAGFPMGFNFTISGQDTNGKDATNELTYMCLKAQESLGLPQPNLSVRLHSRTPNSLLLEASRVISYGDGQPQLFNDEIIIPALLNRGYSYKDARNYAIVGCVEISVPGNTMGLTNASMINMAKILELTINNGVSRTSNKKVGLQTGSLDSFKDFTDFEKAFEKQLKYFIDLMARGSRAVEKVHASLVPTPFLSTVIENCIQKGRDVTNGGAKYNFSGIQGVQIANVADSLMAIKKAVFEEKFIEPLELNKILDNDFEGCEQIRQRLLCQIPKYGNDIDEVDEVADKWVKKFCEFIEVYKNYRGGKFQPGFYTVSAYVPM